MFDLSNLFGSDEQSTDKLVEKIMEEYPDLSKDEARDAAQKVREKFSNALSDLSQEELDEMAEQVKEDHRKAAEGEGFGPYSNMYGVMVMSQRDEHTCEACLDHDGTYYTLDEAKEKSPIPHDACENEECRCSYLPVPDKETFEEGKKGPDPDLSNLRD